MDIYDIAIVVLGSSVVSTLITKFLDWISHSRSKTKQINFAALKLACIFESYALRCSENISDGASPAKFSIPDIDVETFNFTLQEIDAKTIADILRFPNYIQTAKNALEYYSGILDNLDLSDYIDSYNANLGYKALEISIKLKEYYSLPLESFAFEGYDVFEHLRKTYEKYNAKKT